MPLWRAALSLNMARDGWADLGKLPTCLTAQSKEGRRIDLTVANPAFGALVSDYVTHWDLGLPTHAVQQWSTDKVKQKRVLGFSIGKGLGEEPKFQDTCWRQEWALHGTAVRAALVEEEMPLLCV